MDENQNDELEVLNQEEESDFTQTDDETVEDLRERLSQEQKAREKAEEIANNQKIRAEKAESKAKFEVKPQSNASQSSEISQEDVYSMLEAKVPREDIETVKKFAKLEGISIPEALSSSTLKTILNDKAEERNTARATSTGNSKRISHKASDDSLLENFKKGVVPESDEDIARLVKLRSR